MCRPPCQPFNSIWTRVSIQASPIPTTSPIPARLCSPLPAGLNVKQVFLNGISLNYFTPIQTYIPIPFMGDGIYEYSYSVVDGAGNESSPGGKITLNIDSQVPTILGLDFEPGANQQAILARFSEDVSSSLSNSSVSLFTPPRACPFH